MKIAIIGTGIAGNVAAYHLSKAHDITVFEANDYIGGHTHTHSIIESDQALAVDSGFIVFNHKTYPHFVKLLDELGVQSQESHMSFSVKCEKTGLEYNGTTLNSLFAQRRNLLNPGFYGMIRDILRFNREAVTVLQEQDESLSLGEFLSMGHYGQRFIEHYIIPMGAAIWSANPDMMHFFPAHYFIRFFHNHGMLSVNERPVWRVIKGGSNQYVNKLVNGFRDRIRLRSPVKNIQRLPDQVRIETEARGWESFDYVFIASHSDQALAMLADASPLEKHILGSIAYQQNDAILHTDTKVLPKRELAWAAWNYHILKQEQDRVALTYNMNILQGLQSQHTYCVTLNNERAINPEKIIKQISYHHPVFTPEAVSAQQRQREINGSQRTFYCGAYWRYGFHEDGVLSALNALQHFEDTLSYEQQTIPWSITA